MSTAATKTRESVLDRIQKLLALANDSGSTENEAALAAERAQKLMLQEAVTESELTGKTHEKEEQPEIRYYTLPKDNTLWRAQVNLLTEIAGPLGVQAYSYSYRRGREGKTRVLTSKYAVVGFPKDIEAFMMIHQMLEQQLKRDFKVVEKDFFRTTGGSWRGHTAFRNGFYIGFASRVTSRLWESRQTIIDEMEEETKGTELVLVNRAQRLENFVNDTMKFAEDESRLSSLQYDRVGAVYGREAGDRADIGLNRVEQ